MFSRLQKYCGNSHSSFASPGCGLREQFDHVTIWVAEEQLHGPVRPLFRSYMIDMPLAEVFDPWGQIVRSQGEMISTMVRVHRLAAFTDEVKFLALSEPEPCSGEGKSRPRQWLEL
jgi:hypothetical protein